MSFHVFFNFIRGREPSFDKVGRIVCMGSGPEGEVALMISSCRRLFPGAMITLICDPSCRVQGVDERIGFDVLARKRRESFRTIRLSRPDLAVVLVNGDKRYWRQWVQVLFLGAHFRLVFNENGDCFFPKLRRTGQVMKTLFPLGKGTPGAGLAGALLRLVGEVLGVIPLSVGAVRMTLKRKKGIPAFAIAGPWALLSAEGLPKPPPGRGGAQASIGGGGGRF